MRDASETAAVVPDTAPWDRVDSIAWVISIRSHRLGQFRRRLGPWSTEVKIANSVNGHKLDPMRLAQHGKLSRSALAMKRGRIGCYMSHFAVWKSILHELPAAGFGVILEDDVALKNIPDHSIRLESVLRALKSGHTEWDVAFLCHYPRNPRSRGRRGGPHNIQRLRAQSRVPALKKEKNNAAAPQPAGKTWKTISVCGDAPLGEGHRLAWCTNWHVLYGYAVSIQGAKKLMKHAFPINQPVDVQIGLLASVGVLRVLRLEIPICKSVRAGSDTEAIR